MCFLIKDSVPYFSGQGGHRFVVLRRPFISALCEDEDDLALDVRGLFFAVRGGELSCEEVDGPGELLVDFASGLDAPGLLAHAPHLVAEHLVDAHVGFDDDFPLKGLLVEIVSRSKLDLRGFRVDSSPSRTPYHQSVSKA